MTIIEALNTAINELEAVRLPVRDDVNAMHIRNSLMLLDALKNSAVQHDTTEQDNNEEPKGADEA